MYKYDILKSKGKKQWKKYCQHGRQMRFYKSIKKAENWAKHRNQKAFTNG
jgi:hypothetical protein